MIIAPLSLPGVLRIDPVPHRDARGYFVETYRQSVLDAAVGRPVVFVQENQSCSRRGVLRGLHAQTLRSQGKLLRVTEGEIYDVAVDLRPGSATRGQWVAEVLTADNQRQLWIPEGFAHGFLVLSEFANVTYKVTSYYEPDHQLCLKWDDPDLAVSWPLNGVPLLSAADSNGVSLRRALAVMASPSHPEQVAD